MDYLGARLSSARSCQSCIRQLTHSSRMHTAVPKYASPVPHPSVAGPPPPPPTPAASQPEDRVARKRKQAELLQRGLNLRANPSKAGSVLQKRLWTDVSVEETPGI